MDVFLTEKWLPAAKDQVRESTFDSYSRNVRLHICPLLGPVQLQDVTPTLPNDVYRSLNDKGLSPKTVRHIHTLTRKAFSDAMRWEMLHRNPADAANPPKVPRKEMKTWNAPQVQGFLSTLPDDPLLPMFAMLCTTGMRRGEVLGLRWFDVDLSARRLSVQHTLTSVNYRLVFGQPKTNRGRRSVPLDDTTAALLAAHRKTMDDAESVTGAGCQNEYDLIFVRPDDSPIHPDTVSDTFDRRVRASGLPKIRLHDLRRTWATLALEAGVPVKVVPKC